MNDKFQAYWRTCPHLPYQTAYSRWRRGTEPRNASLRDFCAACKRNGIVKVWIRCRPHGLRVPMNWGQDIAYGKNAAGECQSMQQVALDMGWIACLGGVIKLEPWTFGGVKRFYNWEKKNVH